MNSAQTIGIIGVGTMGSGIAQTCAVAGLAVITIDVDDAAIDWAAITRSARLRWRISSGSTCSWR